MDSEILNALEKLAIANTTAFCYGCYREAPTGRCLCCGSDDLMRLMEGVGCEYGTDWVIEELLRANLEGVNVGEAFSESISQCYPEETTVAWGTFNTIEVLREMDQTAWRIAESEWLDNEIAEGSLVTVEGGSTCYWLQDLKSYLSR